MSFSTQFIGEFRNFAFSPPPSDWMPCNGQWLPIASYDPLFKIIGFTYGGDGVSNFALPNLQGVTPVGAGKASDGLNYPLGQGGGAVSVALQTGELPAHRHSAGGSSLAVSASAPGAGVLPGKFAGPSNYSDVTANLYPMNELTIGETGAGQAHMNLQPYAVVNTCIAVWGEFPHSN